MTQTIELNVVPATVSGAILTVEDLGLRLTRKEISDAPPDRSGKPMSGAVPAVIPPMPRDRYRAQRGEVIRFVGATRAAVTIEALPKAVNLVLYGGDDFALVLTVTDPDGVPVDLTGSQAVSEIRPADGTAIVFQFETAVDDNTVTLYLDHQTSNDLPARNVYDVKLQTPDSWVTTLAAGTVAVTSRVTEWPTS